LLLKCYFLLGCRCLFKEAARAPAEKKPSESSEQPVLLVLLVPLWQGVRREGQWGGRAGGLLIAHDLQRPNNFNLHQSCTISQG